MSYFLCGQTGNANRGCEAIIRSTVSILGADNGDIYLPTFDLQTDLNMIKSLGINGFSYSSYPSSFHRYVSASIRRIKKHSLAGYKYIEHSLFSKIKPGDICFNIGGDTYSNEWPAVSVALNRYAQKVGGVQTILWCCSVEKKHLKKDLIEDLSRYTYVFARDQITYENLLSAGLNKQQVIKVCDPAFFLETEEVPLPNGFDKGNTIGLNLSYMVMKQDDDLVYKNIIRFIKWVLSETAMSICLIPHVYKKESNWDDLELLRKIKDEINSVRVCLVDQWYNCCQLKYIISKCRFFVGARTHSTIAAYSSGIPTLVLGYSVKSKGIATDLFGDYKGYVLPFEEISEETDVIHAFEDIMLKEEDIKAKLNEVLPGYRALLQTAIQNYIPKEIQRNQICDSILCTGCGACFNSCPNHSISMVKDQNGFYYPVIADSCISCGKCKQVCPVLNKNIDSGKQPSCFLSYHKKLEIRKQSSSGGVYTALAESIIQKGGVVFGTAFTEDFCNVKKTEARTNKDLVEQRCSKYIQSVPDDTFARVKKYLDQGVSVLYCGTPCEVGGLKAFLKKDFELLFTVDFVCHGVPSARIWQKYLTERIQDEKNTSKIAIINMRDKENGYQKYAIKFQYVNGHQTSILAKDDMFSHLFLNNLSIRPSCFLCSFRQVHRCSDITLGDSWGINDDPVGKTVVLIHTRKGKEIFSNLENVEKEIISYSQLADANKSYLNSPNENALSKRFWHDAEKKSIAELNKRYCSNNTLSRVWRIIHR